MLATRPACSHCAAMPGLGEAPGTLQRRSLLPHCSRIHLSRSASSLGPGCAPHGSCPSRMLQSYRRGVSAGAGPQRAQQASCSPTAPSCAAAVTTPEALLSLLAPTSLASLSAAALPLALPPAATAAGADSAAASAAALGQAPAVAGSLAGSLKVPAAFLADVSASASAASTEVVSQAAAAPAVSAAASAVSQTSEAAGRAAESAAASLQGAAGSAAAAAGLVELDPTTQLVTNALFFLAFLALSVVTLGVVYLNLTAWLDRRQEQADRAGRKPSSPFSSPARSDNGSSAEAEEQQKKKVPRKKPTRGGGRGFK